MGEAITLLAGVDWQIAVVLTILLTSVVLYITELIPMELVAIAMTAVLVLAGVLTPSEGISGFTNQATVTVGAMFVLGSALYQTGSLNYVADALSKCARLGYGYCLAAMIASAAVLSAFINNTAVVAIFIPILMGVALDTDTPASRFLIPLSFASILGGICTMIGTSTNILVASMASDHADVSLGIFDFAPVGLIMLGAGVVYLFFASPHLLADRTPATDFAARTKSAYYVTRVHLTDDFGGLGSKLDQSPFWSDDIEVLDVQRNDGVIQTPEESTTLRRGDIVTMRATLRCLKDLIRTPGLSLVEYVPSEPGDTPILVEAVVPPESDICTHPLSANAHRRDLCAATVAIRDRFVAEGLHQEADEFRLQPGDLILVKTTRRQLDRLRDDDIILIAEHELPSYELLHSFLAVSATAAAVSIAALGIIPIHITAPCAAIALVLTQCLGMNDFYEAIDWHVIFLLAGLLPLGIALHKTGTSALLSHLLTDSLAPLGPVVVLSALYLVTTLLTEVISNSGTVVIMVPIAVATANNMGVDPTPMVMAIAYAGSASFLSPIGYQTNTMVHGPGGYTFFDFTRIGLPLMLLFWAIATIVIPVFFPF